MLHAKFGTCTWTPSWILLYVAMHIFEHMSWMLSYSCKTGRTSKKLNSHLYKKCTYKVFKFLGLDGCVYTASPKKSLIFTNIKYT